MCSPSSWVPSFLQGLKQRFMPATLSADDTADYDTRIRPKLRGPTNPVSRGTDGRLSRCPPARGRYAPLALLPSVAS